MAFDSVGPSGGAGVGQTGSPTTWTHTTVAPSTTVLVFACLDGVATGVTASATLGGVTMTQLGSDVASGTGGTSGILRAWSMAAVASGAHTIVVTCATQNNCTGGSIAYVTTGLGTPATNAGSANGTTSFITVPASTAGNTICGFIGAGNLITATTTPGVSRVGFGSLGVGSNLEGGSGAAGGNAACSDKAAGGSVTVTWSSSSTVAATFGVEVKAAAGGQPFILPQQLAGIQRRRRKSSQIPQFNQQLPSASIAATTLVATAVFPPVTITSGPPCLNGLGGTNTSTTAQYFTDQVSNPKLWVATETWVLPGRGGEWNGGFPQTDFTNFFNARAAQGFTVTMLDVMDSSYDSSANPPFLNGNTWDGLHPFVTGTDPSSGLSNAFWTRMDGLFTAAAAVGMTIGFVFNSNYDSATGGPMNGWSNAQAQAYGTAVGNRYKNTPNLVWLFGNDCYQGTFDTTWNYIATGLTNAGDTHLRIAWWEAEYTSRYETDNNTAVTWGVTNSAANFTYTYNAGYWVIEYAYSEVTARGQSVLLPPLMGDGYFYNAGVGAYSATLDRAMRQEQWWVLTSGARGILFESEEVYQWASAAALTDVTAEWFPSHNQNNIVTSFTSLNEWWNLYPDLTSAFVTAGRGSRVTGYTSGGGGGQYEPAFTNSWVTASITPDGTLAVCYLPNHTTITVTTSMLATGWAASWIDPITGASSSAGTGPTFNSTAKGTNSQGDPDWVLVFQVPGAATASAAASAAAPPGWFPGAPGQPGGIPFYDPTTPGTAPPAAVISIATATAAGAGAVTALAVQQAPAAAAGAAAVTAVATVIAPSAAAGAGAVTAVVTEIPAAAPAAAAGSVTDVATQAVTGTAAGAGAATDVVTQAVIASAAGAGATTAVATEIAGASAAGATAVTDVVTQIATATAAGAGSVTAVGASSGAATGAAAGSGAVTDVVTQIATATAAGAGVVTAVATEVAGASAAGAGVAGPAPVTQVAPATSAGAGAVADVVTQIATAAAAGAGAVTAVGTGSGAATAAIAGTGAVTAVVTQAVTATSGGAGAVTAAVTQAAKATAAGSGAVNASGAITGTASAAGAGAATAKATQAPIAVAAGAAALSALAAQAATAALAGAGAATASGAVQLAFTVGQLTSATSATSTLTGAVMAGAAAGGVLTATDQRTGGPS